MQERIDRLRGEISKLRNLALIADDKAASEMLALAREMEKTVFEMEERLSAAEHR